jgi:hypothetical protein
MKMMARGKRSDDNEEQQPGHALSSALTHLKHAMEGQEEHRQFELTKIEARKRSS